VEYLPSDVFFNHPGFCLRQKCEDRNPGIMEALKGRLFNLSRDSKLKMITGRGGQNRATGPGISQKKILCQSRGKSKSAL